MPAVSVVMPVFNAASTVGAAARSILDGTLSDLELIAIDDGSTDASVARLRALRDDRVRVIEQRHAGIVVALNRGVAEAAAPLIARMDADDIAHPDRLRQQVGRLAAGDVEIVGSRVRIVDEAGEPVASMQRYEKWINRYLEHDDIAAMRFVESPLVHPTVTAVRAVFELGYRENEGAPIPEDYDLWLRAIAAGFRVAKLPEVLLDWVDMGARLTRTGSAYSPDAFDRCRREHLLAGPLAGVTAVALWGAGKTGKPWMRWLIDQGITVRRLYEVSPKKIGNVIHGTRVDHPDAMAESDGVPLIIAVGAAGARDLIEPHLRERAYTLGREAWFVA